jgi:SAM-dependent methyltransferase
MWDERYGSLEKDKFAYGTEPNDFLKDVLPSLELPQKSRCLMLADGEGRNGVYMASLGHHVVSTDSSAKGLEKAQHLAEMKKVPLETKVADLADYDMGTEEWDCIVGIYCHFPPSIRARVLESIPKALRPGGCFVLECYTPDQLEYKTGGPPVAEMMYTSAMLHEFLASHLDIQRNEELVRNVVEGIYHTGKGAVVQFVGRKPLK